VYMGNAVATALAAPIGSYVGGIIGWRGVFWALTPIGIATMVWQWMSLPKIPPGAANPVGKLLGLFKRRNVAFAMAGVMLTFAGAFSTFTYLRPFLEIRTHVTLTQLSLLLLGLGLAGFLGTSGASALATKHLYRMLGILPVILAAVTMWMLLTQHNLWSVALAMIAWGTINSAIPVCWSTWLSRGVSDEPESGGGLLVGAIQLAIMSGGALGGYLLDNVSITGTFVGGSVLLLLSACAVGNGQRLRPVQVHPFNFTGI
jgi:predicted MFS family arabinose efflux permease